MEAIMGKPAVSLFEYANQYISDNNAKGKIGTYKKVKTVVFKLQTFTKTNDFYFDDFDLTFLKKYERYLRDDLKNKQNTIHDNLKIFRRLFNSAIREELIEPQLSPFTKFKLTTEKTTKNYLTEDELKAIEELLLKQGSVMYHHRNLYVFACYAGGIRISDLLQLRWQNFNGIHITLNTQKTRETVSIKLPTKALEIIEVYSKSKPDSKPADYIFPFLKNNMDYSNPKVLFNAISSNTAFANKNLKMMAAKAGIENHISFHCLPHGH
jgi:integrase/recombinase XerD